MARPIAPDTVARRDIDPDPNGPVPVGMKRTRSGKLKRRNIFWRLRKVLLGVVVVLVLGASGGAYGVWASVALPEASKPPQVSFLCDINALPDATPEVAPLPCERGSDAAFAEVGVADAGVPVTWAQIPDVFIKALVAAEDKDFFNHQGVDPTGIARAVVRDLRGSGGQQGGSTITQQYIKNAYGDDAPTLNRKIKEAVQAIKLEQKYGKEEILVRYLNEIYFGRNASGLDAAVRAYFVDTKVEQLDLAKSAYLAALIREPELVDANRAEGDPKKEKERRYATVRRAQVLDAMVAQGYITEAERNAAATVSFDDTVKVRGKDKPGAIKRHEGIGAGHWQTYVEEWLVANTGGRVTRKMLRTEGLRVYTTFDPELQSQAYEAVSEVLPYDQKADPEAAMAVVDPKGRLVAMVGSRDPKSNGFNFATQAKRNPGSAFKPIALAAFLNQGQKLSQTFDNPLSIKVPNEPDLYSIKGDETPYPIDLVQATVISSNTVFGQLQLQQRSAGNKPTLEMATSLGIPETAFTMPDSNATPRLALGSVVNLAPYDMAAAYSAFGRLGEQISPHPVKRVTDARGKVLYEHPETPVRVMNRDTAEQVNYALTQVVEDNKGTGHRETRPLKAVAGTVAGKTGSMAFEVDGKPTQESTDAWFVGYNCRVTAAVWMGNKDNLHPMGQVQDVRFVNGGTLPARIFAAFMKKGAAGRECPVFAKPAGAVPTTTVPPPTTATTRDRDGRGDGDENRRWWERGPWFSTTTTIDPDVTTTTRRDQRPTSTRRPGRGGGETEEDPPAGAAGVAPVPPTRRAG